MWNGKGLCIPPLLELYVVTWIALSSVLFWITFGFPSVLEGNNFEMCAMMAGRSSDPKDNLKMKPAKGILKSSSSFEAPEGPSG